MSASLTRLVHQVNRLLYSNHIITLEKVEKTQKVVYHLHLLIQTNLWRFDKQHLNHLSAWPWILFSELRVFKSSSWLTVSNADDKSNSTNAVILPLSIPMRISLDRLMSRFSTLWWVRYADWRLSRRSCFLRYSESLEKTIRSGTLDK